MVFYDVNKPHLKCKFKIVFLSQISVKFLPYRDINKGASG